LTQRVNIIQRLSLRKTFTRLLTQILIKLRRRKNSSKVDPKIILNMSKKLRKSKFSPGKWDFKENKEKQGDMFLKSFYIGDTYADPFSKGIKSINY